MQLAKFGVAHFSRRRWKVRENVQTFVIALGILALLAIPFCWILAWGQMMAGANGELQLISVGDRKGCYRLLEFGSWQDGAGECSPSTYALLPDGSKIIRHRVGHCYGVLTQFNYYEAEYITSDDTTIIDHATGPLPLFTRRYSRLISITTLCGRFACGMFRFAARWKSGPSSEGV